MLDNFEEIKEFLRKIFKKFSIFHLKFFHGLDQFFFIHFPTLIFHYKVLT